MKYPWIREYLLAKKGAEADHQAEWNWDRYMIGGKMFAAVCYDDATGNDVYVTLKLPPEECELMRAMYADIIPGYYMNKRHWVSVRTAGSVPDDLLRDLLDRAYATVLDGFSKKRQAELLNA